ncbi:MAG: hypothetical protein GAK30_03660 [Paracidovorax wautersii]|uniref:TRAP transporter small permease protein n=1 Tax=Paracidovorax wautersii TaxID=1177982 RepID=A0A7V8FKV2_9BURK|nr:MAG: hypothetical protein GAK30_03660 [Paracidovorax wautersii]
MSPCILRWMDRLYLAAVWLSAAAITLMSLIIPWGVFSRYILGTGSDWPEPIAILLMMVFTFVGASVSYRAGGHIAVTMVSDHLPPQLKFLAAWLIDVLMAGLCVFVFWFGLNLSLETWRQGIAELPWLPVGATYLPIPLGALITLLFVIEKRLLGPQSGRPVATSEEHPQTLPKEA